MSGLAFKEPSPLSKNMKNFYAKDYQPHQYHKAQTGLQALSNDLRYKDSNHNSLEFDESQKGYYAGYNNNLDSDSDSDDDSL